MKRWFIVALGYALCEKTTLQGMKDDASKVCEGLSWTPNVTV